MTLMLAIVGAPMVGKRTLLARLTGRDPDDVFDGSPIEFGHQRGGAAVPALAFAAVEFAATPPATHLLTREQLSDAARQLLEADAILFVADSQAARYEVTLQALANLSAVLQLARPAKPLGFFLSKVDADPQSQGQDILDALLASQFPGCEVGRANLGEPSSAAAVRSSVDSLLGSVDRSSKSYSSTQERVFRLFAGLDPIALARP